MILGLFQSDAPKVLEQAIAAEASHTAQCVSITSWTNLKGRPESARYILTFMRPDKLRLDILRDGGHKTHFFRGTSYIGYDANSRTFITRVIKGDRSLTQVLSATVGELEQPVLYSLDAKQAEAFLRQLQPQNWAISKSRTEVQLIASPKAGSVIGLVFSRQTMLPQRITFKNGSRLLRWTYVYAPSPHSVAFNPPAGSREVGAFYSHAPPPTPENREAALIQSACITAYRHLTSVHYIAEGSGGRSDVYWAGDHGREDKPNGSWAFDSTTLTIKSTPKKASFRGKCKVSAVASYVRAAGLEMDPGLDMLLSGRSPFAVLFTPGMASRVVGHIGAESDILELTGPGHRIQVQIRRSDHLLADTLSEILGSNGSVIAKSERRMRYISANGGVPRNIFKPPLGSYQPLTSLRTRA